jgi:hypothetical protein
LYCGSETTGYCPSEEFANSVNLGTAIAVSGAAVSPNMGYHSSPAITALLTVFNVRLGAWFGNPKKTTRKESNPAASAKLLLSELAGVTDAESNYVYVSDGGHFENMGVYELIRRRCRFIVAIDAGADPKFHENVGRVVRQVRIDFGISLEVDLSSATPGLNGLCRSHVVVGRIHYGDVHKVPKSAGKRNLEDPDFSYEQNDGIILWVKNSLTGDEPGDLVNYAAMHPTFPYDSTLNQFFTESQFESYRALGIHTILKSLIFPAGRIAKFATTNGDPSFRAEFECPLSSYSTRVVFEAIYSQWLSSPSQYVAPYVLGNDGYARLQNDLRTDPNLIRLATELYGSETMLQALRDEGPHEITMAERLMANEMFALLENVFLSLDFERNCLHPVHQGWLKTFVNWANSPTLSTAWAGFELEYSPSFRKFIELVKTKEGKSK